MDLTMLMNELLSLTLKLDCVTKSICSLDRKINEIAESLLIGGETVRKSANSINIIIRFLAGLRKLTPGELKSTLIEADAILNTVSPIPTDQNLEQTLEWNVTKDKLKTILKEVFDLLNSLPHDSNVDATNPVASTSFESRNDNSEEEEKKMQIWRKYKNKYNYIDKLKFKLPPLDDQVEEVEPPQNDVNPIVQNANIVNYLNDNTLNNINDAAQNDGNDLNILNNKTTYTINDIIQNEKVYEMLKSRLKNSPYKDPVFINNVRNSKLTLTLHNGKTIAKPVRHVAPLIVLTKCDDLCPIPLQNKKKPAKHFQSTSNKINDSNSNNTTEKITKRETRANKKIDITNSFNTNVKTRSEKRRSTAKNSKNEPSKKKKN